MNAREPISYLHKVELYPVLATYENNCMKIRFVDKNVKYDVSFATQNSAGRRISLCPVFYIWFSKDNSKKYKDETIDSLIKKMEAIVNDKTGKSDLELLKEYFNKQFIIISLPVIYGPSVTGHFYYWLNEDKFVKLKNFATDTFVSCVENKTDFLECFDDYINWKDFEKIGMKEDWKDMGSFSKFPTSIFYDASKDEEIDKNIEIDKYKIDEIDEKKMLSGPKKVDNENKGEEMMNLKPNEDRKDNDKDEKIGSGNENGIEKTKNQYNHIGGTNPSQTDPTKTPNKATKKKCCNCCCCGVRPN